MLLKNDIKWIPHCVRNDNNIVIDWVGRWWGLSHHLLLKYIKYLVIPSETRNLKNRKYYFA